MEKGVKISDVNNILYHKNIRGNEKIPVSSGQNIPQVVTTEELRNYIKEDIEGSGEENTIEKITFNGQEAIINEATKTAEITYIPPSEKDPTVPSHVKSITLQDINNWNLKQDNITDLDEIRNNALLGKNAYQKPSTGIPKTDLSQEVQNALDNPSITSETDPVFTASPAYNITSSNISSWNNKYSIPNTGIPLSDLSEEVQDAIENAGSLTEETDPIFTASAAHGITSSDITNWNGKQSALTFDSTPTSGSNNPVKSGGIYTALQGKEDTLTFDSTPTASSTNPVTSGGVKTALDLKANQSTTYTKTEVDALFDDVAYLGDDDGQATTLPFDPQADTVWNKAQILGSAQQAQARNNIGAVGSVTVNGTTYTPTNGNVDLGTISGGGSSVTVDSSLSTSSTNPVQNSVITTALNGKVGSSTITSIVFLTEAAYTALATKDASTLYVIIES